MINYVSESVSRVALPSASRGAGDAGLAPGDFLQKMSAGVHELSQPVTVLLCLMEYGSKLEASEEMKQVMAWSIDAVERLKVTVIAMQSMVQDEQQRDNA